MDNILQDFHHWGIACYERFPERKYDVFTHRYITSGYRIFHGGDGTMIYVSEYARSDLRNLLTPGNYNNMDYYKIIYKLKKACYFDGGNSLRLLGLTKDWVNILFNSPRFRELYGKFAPADMDFNYMRNLLDDYVNKRVVLAGAQKEHIFQFIEKIICPVFMEEESRVCEYYKAAFLQRG